MSELLFRSADQRFGLRISLDTVDHMAALCRMANRAETGGILAGRYSERHDCAVVTEVTGPPPDSRSGPTWFKRGVRGLQQLIERLWRLDRSFYLGEWHYHPYGSPRPSTTDIKQMSLISANDSYSCPEPILVILGGDPNADLDISVFVFQRGESYLELPRVIE